MSPSLFALILGTVSLSAVAQIVLKAGVSRSAHHQLVSAADPGFLLSIMNMHTAAGLGLYGLSAILWLFVLSRLDVSVAYPFVGLGFLVTMLLGSLVLHEPIGMVRILGTIFVAFGVMLIVRS